MRKKLLALLLAAALALSLLAGCGGESVASALLKLLDGRYPNISIEIDPELEADLRQAIRKAEAENAGDDAAVIRAALEKLVGSTITFRNLRNGQKGATAFDLVFYAGSDPGKAAQAAYSQWHPILSNVPDDGQYDTSLAMVETNSGVWMLVKATVEKAGTVDKPDSEPEPEPEEPKTPYTLIMNDNNTAISEITIGTTDGFNHVFFDEGKGTGSESEEEALKTARADGFDNVVITLDAGTEYTVTEQLAADFKGTLKGENESSKAKITLSGTSGLFGTIRDGTVQNLAVTVTGTINTGTEYVSNAYATGAVADVNNGGSITGCTVTVNGSITAASTVTGDAWASAGGIVGINGGTIEHCDATISGSITAAASSTNTDDMSITEAYAGGIAGLNDGGTIESSCSVELNVGTIQATATSTGADRTSASAGGIAGNDFINNGVNGVKCDPATGTGTIQATVTGSSSDGSVILTLKDSTVTVDPDTIQLDNNIYKDGTAYAGTKTV